MPPGAAPGMLLSPGCMHLGTGNTLPFLAAMAALSAIRKAFSQAPGHKTAPEIVAKAVSAFRELEVAVREKQLDNALERVQK